jgi:hypothetical protein
MDGNIIELSLAEKSKATVHLHGNNFIKNLFQ